MYRRMARQKEKHVRHREMAESIPTQQTHPIQITDPPCTHLRSPRLEQYIVY